MGGGSLILVTTQAAGAHRRASGASEGLDDNVMHKGAFSTSARGLSALLTCLAGFPKQVGHRAGINLGRRFIIRTNVWLLSD